MQVEFFAHDQSIFNLSFYGKMQSFPSNLSEIVSLEDTPLKSNRVELVLPQEQISQDYGT